MNKQLEQAILASRQTIVGLAKALGCNRKTLYKWLDGTNAIPFEKLQQLCDLLHLPEHERAAQFEGRGYSVPQISSAASVHHLRAPVRDFVGRDAEIDQIVTALRVAAQDGTVAAISGVRGLGGIGKTELALVAAQRLLSSFPDGQVEVALHGAGTAPVSATHALQTILRAFDPHAKLPEELSDLQHRYRSELHGKHMLVIADDAAHAAQVHPLLPPAGSALIVTSRQRFVLPGMVHIDLGALPVAEAVQVLCTICPRIGSDAPQLAQLCAYLPLALRISASYLATYDTVSVAHYLTLLAAERMKHLRDPLDPDNPQASVEATMALSYNALDQTAQTALCQLSVFGSDVDHAAALAVLDSSVLVGETALRELRWRSLLEWDADRQRYRLHDLVQAFAADRLDDTQRVQRRYAEHFSQRIAETATFGDQAPPLSWLEAVERELAHLRFALGWFGTHGAGEAALRLAVALGPFWLARDAIREGSQWIESVLDPISLDRNDTSVELHARALLLLGELRRVQGDLDAAKQLLERSGDLLIHRLEDDTTYADVAFHLGILAADRNAYDEANGHFTTSLALFQRDNRLQRVGAVLVNLGRIAMNRGDLADAERWYGKAAATLRITGDQEQLGWLLINVSSLHSDRGAHDVALEVITESLDHFTALGHQNGLAWASYLKGTILANQGSYADARTVLDQCLQLFTELSGAMGLAMTYNKLTSVTMAHHDIPSAWHNALRSLNSYRELNHDYGLGMSIEHIAMLVADNDGLLSARLLSWAEQQFASLRGQIAPIDQILYDHAQATIHTHLVEDVLRRAWDEGRALTRDEAVALALAACEERP